MSATRARDRPRTQCRRGSAARRPSNGTGGLLCLCGWGLLVAALGNTSVPALIVVGQLFSAGTLPCPARCGWAHPGFVQLTQHLEVAVAAGVVVLSVRVLRSRLRRTDRRHRPGVAAVYAYGGFTILFLILSATSICTTNGAATGKDIDQALPRACQQISWAVDYHQHGHVDPLLHPQSRSVRAH
jgi:uncharacterized membrane protein YdcZ (DUF606 family)